MNKLPGTNNFLYSNAPIKHYKSKYREGFLIIRE